MVDTSSLYILDGNSEGHFLKTFVDGSAQVPFHAISGTIPVDIQGASITLSADSIGLEGATVAVSALSGTVGISGVDIEVSTLLSDQTGNILGSHSNPLKTSGAVTISPEANRDKVGVSDVSVEVSTLLSDQTGTILGTHDNTLKVSGDFGSTTLEPNRDKIGISSIAAGQGVQVSNTVSIDDQTPNRDQVNISGASVEVSTLLSDQTGTILGTHENTLKVSGAFATTSEANRDKVGVSSIAAGVGVQVSNTVSVEDREANRDKVGVSSIPSLSVTSIDQVYLSGGVVGVSGTVNTNISPEANRDKVGVSSIAVSSAVVQIDDTSAVLGTHANPTKVSGEFTANTNVTIGDVGVSSFTGVLSAVFVDSASAYTATHDNPLVVSSQPVSVGDVAVGDVGISSAAAGVAFEVSGINDIEGIVGVSSLPTPEANRDKVGVSDVSVEVSTLLSDQTGTILGTHDNTLKVSGDFGSTTLEPNRDKVGISSIAAGQGVQVSNTVDINDLTPSRDQVNVSSSVGLSVTSVDQIAISSLPSVTVTAIEDIGVSNTVSISGAAVSSVIQHNSYGTDDALPQGLSAVTSANPLPIALHHVDESGISVTIGDVNNPLYAIVQDGGASITVDAASPLNVTPYVGGTPATHGNPVIVSGALDVTNTLTVESATAIPTYLSGTSQVEITSGTIQLQGGSVGISSIDVSSANLIIDDTSAVLGTHNNPLKTSGSVSITPETDRDKVGVSSISEGVVGVSGGSIGITGINDIEGVVGISSLPAPEANRDKVSISSISEGVVGVSGGSVTLTGTPNVAIPGNVNIGSVLGTVTATIGNTVNTQGVIGVSSVQDIPDVAISGLNTIDALRVSGGDGANSNAVIVQLTTENRGVNAGNPLIVSQRTGVLQAENGALMVSSFPINTSSTGIQSISGDLDSSSGSFIKLLNCFLVASGDTTIRFWSSGTAGGTTPLTGPIPLTLNSGFTLGYNPQGWFKTYDSEGLAIELSDAVAVGGCLSVVRQSDATESP